MNDVFSKRFNGSVGVYKRFLSQVPSVQNEAVQKFEVVVRGDTFHSREVRKVMIRSYRPMTFVQTDKPIYLPGQTGNCELIICDVDIVPYIDPPSHLAGILLGI